MRRKGASRTMSYYKVHCTMCNTTAESDDEQFAVGACGCPAAVKEVRAL